MTYVQEIEPRLTPARSVQPRDTTETLAEWARDLEQELMARLARLSDAELRWQPHGDSNPCGTTAWHVARWLDVLATRAFTGAPAASDIWHVEGWARSTGYDPAGIGYLGLGTLTGYTPEQMRAVPPMDAESLSAYLSAAVEQLCERVVSLRDRLFEPVRGGGLTPYQTVASTLQGSFGHIGEIDTLVALRARLAEASNAAP